MQCHAIVLDTTGITQQMLHIERENTESNTCVSFHVICRRSGSAGQQGLTEEAPNIFGPDGYFEMIIITRELSNRNQIWCVKTGEYMAFGSIVGSDYCGPPL